MLLKIGSRGVAVAQVQRLLGLTADGVFGPNTQGAVLAFQRDKGLTADGIVGDVTMAALRGGVASTLPAFIKDASPAFPVSNYGARNGAPPSFIVVHHSETRTANSTQQVLRARGLSTHFEVEKDGTVYRYLNPATCVAWHCGGNVNARSIGIDVTHMGEGADFPEVQVQALRSLVQYLCGEFGIPLVVAPEPWKAERDSHNRAMLMPGIGVYRHRNIGNTICPAGLPLEEVIK